MPTPALHPRVRARREFLKLALSGPLAIPGVLSAFYPRRIMAEGGESSECLDALLDGQGVLVSDPDEVVNVFDLREVARSRLSPAHFAYIETGVYDNLTVRANRAALNAIYIRARRMIDVASVDLSTEFLGTRWRTPLIFAPAGSQKAFHPEGELAVARASEARGVLQILSTATTTPPEVINSARNAPVWFQLYGSPDWSITERLVRRAKAAGCEVIVITVDATGDSQSDSLERHARNRDRNERCSTCHSVGLGGALRRKPMFDGINISHLHDIRAPSMTWSRARRLRDAFGMKIVLKGIVHPEDAALCVEHGIDGIIVSNHGGRYEESLWPSIDALPGVARVVNRRIPILIDSGFRRGTDLFKALALGAQGVCVGRPYLWGLAAFGQEGVEKVIDLTTAELIVAMQQAGTISIDKITPEFVGLERHA
jgi:isopentenyl diphosphate isomerase/L-lactate dehydrogenase-like FMN-dependent dehydrogenase